MLNNIQLGLLIVAIVGIGLTYHRIRLSYKTQKAIFFKEIYLTLRREKELRDIYYKIEYNELQYTPEFHGGPEEGPTDRLLSFFDLICDLYNQRILTKQEMSFFRYDIKRVYQNESVQEYINFLQRWYISIGEEIAPFNSFISYCQKEFGQAQFDKTIQKKQSR
jgi:hypothetical protein